MSKLSLRVDPKVLESANRYAQARGLSLPALVGAYLFSITGGADTSKMPTVLKSLRGSLKNADSKAYGAHLAQKYLWGDLCSGVKR